jgi:chorismate mutase
MEKKEDFPLLNELSAFLGNLEEAIIWRLIGRAQFRHNPRVYEAGGSGFPNELSGSLFDVRLRYQERMDAVFGRYTAAEERPYSARLPPAQRVCSERPDPRFPIGDYNLVNLMPEIVLSYREFVPKICRPGRDGHYGSSVEYDVFAVQALGRRIHYGSFYVAERKYLDAPGFYRELTAGADTGALISALTRPEVEEATLRRVREKAKSLQGRASPSRVRLDPDAVSGFYRDTIMPLTREGEARYLMNRFREEPPGRRTDGR